MIRKVFAIYDEKAEAYLQPFFQDTIGQATRAIVNCFRDPEHMFVVNHVDFTLYQLGTFDDNTAELVSDKRCLGTITEYLSSWRNSVQENSQVFVKPEKNCVSPENAQMIDFKKLAGGDES